MNPDRRSATQGQSEDDLAATRVNNELGATVVNERPIGSDQAGRSSGAPKPAQDSGSGQSSGFEFDHLGDFKLIRKLGQGGMGAVYLAHQQSLDRQVALKILSKEMAAKPNFVERFYREARAGAKLNHPNVVQAYAVGEDKGYHFVALELIDGKSMQYWVDKVGKLSLADTLHVAIRVADALRFAHSNNLIHRDIKPDNVLVTKSGMVKVSDLGLAKNIDDSDMSLTQSGTGLGTPYYMAPEQARNAKRVDGKTDVYAFGAMLYHFLTGAPPFLLKPPVGDRPPEQVQLDLLALITAKEKNEPPPLRKFRRDVPDSLAMKIEKMILSRPENRQANFEEILRDLTVSAASPSLSFIDGAVASPAPGGAASSGAATRVAVSAPTAANLPHASRAATQDDAAPSAIRQNDSGVKSGGQTSAGLGEDEWYVRYTAADGKIKVARLKTDKIQQFVKSGQLDNKAQVSRKSSGDFRPIGSVPAFDKVVRSQIVQKTVATKAAAKENEFKKLYRAAERQQRWGWIYTKFSIFFSNVKGVVGLVIYLVLIAAIIIGGYIGIRNYAYPYISKEFLNKTPSGTAPAGDQKAAETANPAPTG